MFGLNLVLNICPYVRSALYFEVGYKQGLFFPERSVIYQTSWYLGIEGIPVKGAMYLGILVAKHSINVPNVQ